MELFGMGLGEIVTALVVALIIWGPGKLPELAQKAAKALAYFRSLRSDVTSMVRNSMLEEQENTHTPTPPQPPNAANKPEITDEETPETK